MSPLLAFLLHAAEIAGYLGIIAGLTLLVHTGARS